MSGARMWSGSSWVEITDESHRNATNPHPEYRRPLVVYPISIGGQASGTTTVAERELFGSSRFQAMIDLSSYSQVRLVCRVITPLAGAKIGVRRLPTGAFSSAQSLDGNTPSSLEIDVSLAGVIVSSWINLASGAMTDTVLTPVEYGAAGTLAIGWTALQGR